LIEFRAILTLGTASLYELVISEWWYISVDQLYGCRMFCIKLFSVGKYSQTAMKVVFPLV
jgi:hypothetical protein